MSTHPTPDRPQLWRVMEQAVIDAPAPQWSIAGNLYAAQIRAVRDWLPDDPEPEPGYRFEQRHIIWRHNQRLRAMLTAEADRAERGDG
jgi:hypothetical protein